jgi:hypothetical protein
VRQEEGSAGPASRARSLTPRGRLALCLHAMMPMFWLTLHSWASHLRVSLAQCRATCLSYRLLYLRT